MEYNWDVTADQDWLDYLLKSVIKGTGFPSNYVDESQNVDFARTVIMQNQFLVRKIVSDQEYFQKSMTDFIKKIYANEFRVHVNKTPEEEYKKQKQKSDSKEKNMEIGSYDEIYNALEIQYPTPISLNLTNINEQISNAMQASDFIISNYIDENDTLDTDIPKLKLKMKKKISQQLIPSIDWDMYDDLFDQCKKEMTEEKIREKMKPTEEEDTDDIDELGDY